MKLKTKLWKDEEKAYVIVRKNTLQDMLDAYKKQHEELAKLGKAPKVLPPSYYELRTYVNSADK